VASARSSSLRSTPGYTTRPTIQAVTPAMPTMPDLPAAPDFGGRVNPATLGQQTWIRTQLSNLPGKYAPILGAMKANAKAGLAGHGGWKFRTDDPSTPADESLMVDFDPNAGLGEKDKQAVRGEDEQANARGLLESSFRNKAVGAALQRNSEQAKAVLNQYAANIATTLGQQSSEVTNLGGQLVGLFGQDAAYFAENPPPTPPIPPDPRDEATWGPEQYAVAPPRQTMTYADFLKGRKSTGALARAWDAEFNYNRRFGGQ
jgi:hypothetical protein